MTERADQLHHDNAPAHSTAVMRTFLAKHQITQVCQSPYGPDMAPCYFWLFPKLNSPLKGKWFVNATVTVHKTSQRHLTADWLAPRESDYSRMHSKVSSDWLPSYIKATPPVLEIFKMAGSFPNSSVYQWYMRTQEMGLNGTGGGTSSIWHWGTASQTEIRQGQN